MMQPATIMDCETPSAGIATETVPWITPKVDQSTRIPVASFWRQLGANFSRYHVLLAPFYQSEDRWFFVIYVFVYFGVCALFPYVSYYYNWPMVRKFRYSLLICASLQILHHFLSIFVTRKVQAEEAKPRAPFTPRPLNDLAAEYPLQFSPPNSAPEAEAPTPSDPAAIEASAVATPNPIQPQPSETEKTDDDEHGWEKLWGIPILAILPYVGFTIMADCPYYICLYGKNLPKPEEEGGGVWNSTSCSAAHPHGADWCAYVNQTMADADHPAGSCDCFKWFYGRKYIGLMPLRAFAFGVFVLQPVVIDHRPLLLLAATRKPSLRVKSEA